MVPVQVADQRHQVVAAVHHVVALVVQIPIAGLQRLVLLGRQRVDLTERRQVPLRLLQPFDLFGAHIRHRAVRHGCGGVSVRRTVGPGIAGLIRPCGRPSPSSNGTGRPSSSSTGNRLVGAVLRHQFVQPHTDGIGHLLRQLPVYGGQPFTVHVQLVLAPLQSGHARLDLVALGAQRLQLLVVAGYGGLQLLAACDPRSGCSPPPVRPPRPHRRRLRSICAICLRRRSFNVSRRVPAFRPASRALSCSSPACRVRDSALRFASVHAILAETSCSRARVQALFQFPFAVGQIVEVGVLAGGCLRGGQGPVQIIQFEPMRLRILPGFGDALVHRRHLPA